MAYGTASLELAPNGTLMIAYANQLGTGKQVYMLRERIFGTTTGNPGMELGTTGNATTGNATTGSATAGTTGPPPNNCQATILRDCFSVCGAGNVLTCKCVGGQPSIECNTAEVLSGATATSNSSALLLIIGWLAWLASSI
jgi:hypothetical protein